MTVQFDLDDGTNDNPTENPVAVAVLSELFDLHETSVGPEWAASARWIKYEELVEGVDHHWGRPHVPFISLKAMNQLKQSFHFGAVLLDLQTSQFKEIQKSVVVALKSEYHLETAQAETLVGLLERLKTTRARDRLMRRSKSSVHSMVSTFSFESNTDKVTPVTNVHEPTIYDNEMEVCQIYSGCRQELTRIVLVMVRMAHGVHLPQLMEPIAKIRFIFLILGPPMATCDYHELGRAVGIVMSNQKFRDVALMAKNKMDIIDELEYLINEAVIAPVVDIDTNALVNVENLRRVFKRLPSMALFNNAEPEGNEVLRKFSPVPVDKKPVESESTVSKPNPFLRTGRPFGGVINDIKNRLPFYSDDFKSALNFQCVTSILFIFCANFAIVMAIAEVLSTISSLPKGVFVKILTFCKTFGANYLAARFWTGLWSFVLLTTLAMVEAPFLMKYLTRFTEDVFTGMIAMIYITSASRFIFGQYGIHPLQTLMSYCEHNAGLISQMGKNHSYNSDPDMLHYNDTMVNLNLTSTKSRPLSNQPDTALVSTLLFIITFILAYFFKQLRMSVYCGRTVRRALGDFGLPLSIIVVTLFSEVVFHKTYIKNVNVNPTFGLTAPEKRGWLVNPLGTEDDPLPTWVIPAAIIPALLVTILFYAQVEIIEALLAKKERGLKKPSGFHMDLIVCGIIVFICSILGLQWLCPTAVQSLSHASSLTVMKRGAPGEVPRIDFVLEQRVTLIVIGLLHGAAACAGTVLSLIPTAALFGVLFYLGVMCLAGLQFWHRFVLIFVPEKYFPDEDYCQNTTMPRMHLYTAVQVICFVCLFVVNMMSEASLAFPFVLLLIALFRKFIVPIIFSPTELIALDGKPEHDENVVPKEEEDKDVYDELSNRG